VLAVAAETSLSPAQVSLAWLLGRQPAAATPHVPIIGPRTVDHLDAYLQALDAELTAEQVHRLDQVSAPALGAPHDGAAGAVTAIVGGSPAAVYLPRCQSASRSPQRKSGSIWPPEPSDATENEPRRRI
jgi:hypothetical protein